MKDRILHAIEKNSKIDIKDLAKMIGATEEEVAACIAEMEADRIICG